MKFFKSIIAIALAFFLFSHAGGKNDSQLAAASEIAQASIDHSACEHAIAKLEAELEEAQKSFDMILRIELEFVPGIFGDWAKVSFHSAPIEINAAAAETVAVGTDLCQGMDGEADFFRHILDCCIIVEAINPK